MTVRLLVIAKEPVPGRVKTRLCPPCTFEQAAAVARAALDRDFGRGGRVNRLRAHFGGRRGLRTTRGLEPDPPARQRARRTARARFRRRGRGPGVAPHRHGHAPSHRDLIAAVADGLETADAVLAPAMDGGWWALALREPAHARVLREVPMSTSDTGLRTVRALRALNLRVAHGPALRDVDTAADAWAVASAEPKSLFGVAVREHVPRPRAAVRLGALR